MPTSKEADFVFEKAYNRDYVRALIKTINTIDEMSVDEFHLLHLLHSDKYF